MMQQTASTDTATRTAEQKSRWRQVLGQYPTGITIITSTDDSGSPVGMIVGTFTSVSEEPPLVGFMPQLSSETFAQIERTGRFRASVLAAVHEKFCRDFFASPKGDRFSGEEWDYDEHGIPRLKESVAWFDATVHDIIPAGDHVIVLGEVTDLGLGPNPGDVPLVFLNGGYGSFTTPQRGFDPDDFGGRLRLANSVAGTVKQLSMELGVECALSTVVRDEVVVLTAADVRSPYVGTSFPFAAPMDPGFAAWSTPELLQTWIDNGRQLTGPCDTALIKEVLDLTRKQGYAISFGHTMGEAFNGVLASARQDRSAFTEVWEKLEQSYQTYRLDPRPHRYGSVLQAPVFGPDGHTAFELVVSGFGSGVDVDRFRHIASTAVSYGQQITTMIGGTVPDSYLGFSSL